MAKMFYSLEETAQQLGISIDQVKSLGANGDLQVFRDRDKMMFKRDQVDSLAEERGDTQAVSGDSDSVILLEDTGGSGDDGGSEGLAGLGESSVLGGSGIAMGDDVKEESGVLADSGEGSGVNIL